MDLANPKRLYVFGLEGLARLLEFSTSCFEVEIGSKLVHIANAFRLLPSAANADLESSISAIVRIEAQMQFPAPSPFTKSGQAPRRFRGLHELYPLPPIYPIPEEHFRDPISSLPLARDGRASLRHRTACFQTMDHKDIIPRLASHLGRNASGCLTNSIVDDLVRLWRTQIPACMGGDSETINSSSMGNTRTGWNPGGSKLLLIPLPLPRLQC